MFNFKGHIVLDLCLYFPLEHVGLLADSFGHHESMKTMLCNMMTSRGSYRHVYQNSSILYNMHKAGVFTDNGRKTFIEFGSGRGLF